MNQSKKNRFQHKNTRRVKLNARSDNLFIPGPVQYQPNPAPLSSANFVNATTTNHHSSRSRNNAWGNNNTTNNNKQAPQPSSLDTLTQQPQSNPSTDHPSSDPNNKPHTSPNVAPITRRIDNIEFPALDANESKPSNNKTTSNPLSLNKSNRKEIEQQSSWLQYDHDDGQDFDALDDYEATPNNNNNGSGSHTTTPHKSHHSLHDLHEKDINDSSQITQDAHQTPHNRFPTHQPHANQQHYNDDNTYAAAPQRHHQTSYSRPYQSQRRNPNAINVDIHSFKRHNNNNNGYNNNYDQQHAAVLDGFNGKRRGGSNAPQRATKRRSNKYTVKIRRTKGAREDAQEVHWSNKKRFVPDGSIQNFTPEFKPYRRPSYNTFLQLIKDRDKGDDEVLEQFQRDRKRYAKQHAKNHVERLQNNKLQKQQLLLKQQQCKEQNDLNATLQSQLQNRGSGVSRSRHLLQQHLYGLNTNLLQHNTRMQGSPPGIQPLVPQVDVHNLLRNIGTNPSSSNNTPPILPFNQSQLLQHTLNNQLSPNPVPMGTNLSATTAPWRGANWTANKHQKMDATQAAAAAANAIDTGSNTNTSSRGTSPFTNNQNLANVSPFVVATANNVTSNNTSNTVTPQQPNPPSLNNTIPSISLTDVTAFRRGSGGQNAAAAAAAASGNVQLLQQKQSQQTTKINLMGFGTQTQTPTQFSQSLYNQHQLLQQQQQQRQQQLLNAQAQKQQAMNNIWQQNKQQEYNPQPPQQQWPRAQQQPGAAAAAAVQYAQDQYIQQQQQQPGAQTHSYHPAAAQQQPGAQQAHTQQQHHQQQHNQWNTQQNHAQNQWNQNVAHNQWPQQQQQQHNQNNWNQYGAY